MQEFKIGGWTVEPTVNMPQKVATAFPETVGSIVGATYKDLLIYCGKQVVNGTNYMVICLGEKATNPPAKFLAKVILNEAPDGKFSLVSIEPITADASAGYRGGWDLNPKDVPDGAKEALEKALSVFCGAKYDMLKYCGSQVVEGMNYMFICKGTSTTAEPVDFAAKVIVNVALNNDNISVTIEKII